jgi:integrase
VGSSPLRTWRSRATASTGLAGACGSTVRPAPQPGTPVFGPVKEKKSRPRTIPISDEVMAALVEHVRTFGLGLEGPVFSNDDEPIRGTTFGDIWARAARPLGIPVKQGFHQLRPYDAAVLILGGADIVLVQWMSGHASLATTQIYRHLFPESDDMV